MENNELAFLMRQYEILISRSEHHHIRWNDHWRVYLTVLGIIMGAMITVLAVGSADVGGRISSFAWRTVSGIGAAVALLAMISLNRIRNDHKLIWHYLRRIEERIKCVADGWPFISQFTVGRKFFSDEVADLPFRSDGQEVEGEKGMERFTPTWVPRLWKLNQSHLATVTFGLFALFFLIGLLFPGILVTRESSGNQSSAGVQESQRPTAEIQTDRRRGDTMPLNVPAE
ncbi:MAG TPA: hypothetical protein VM221_13590 [Armatimonadota bacterium]|nr:hypothetical protein [Armatimonadota bacterium]